MKRILVLAAVVLVGGGTAWAQDAPGPASSLGSRSGYASVGVDAGFMIDPDMTAGMVSLDYYVTDEISVGPYLHIGGGADNSYWGVSGQVKFSAALANNPNIRPYATVGIGFVELDFEDMDDTTTTYLFPVGGGMEFEINDMISIEGGAMFDITKDTFGGLIVGLRILL
ncbi:MAG TPA: outer membrane beta-barrel protein [bacterium]|nr:outer membrane beta-barrel protein [bacterium]